MRRYICPLCEWSHEAVESTREETMERLLRSGALTQAEAEEQAAVTLEVDARRIAQTIRDHLGTHGPDVWFLALVDARTALSQEQRTTARMTDAIAQHVQSAGEERTEGVRAAAAWLRQRCEQTDVGYDVVALVDELEATLAPAEEAPLTEEPVAETPAAQEPPAEPTVDPVTEAPTDDGTRA